MSETVNERTPELARILREVLAGFKSQGIGFCILRNYDELPEYTTHDVDVLVIESHLSRAVETVRDACVRCNWRLAAEVCKAGCHSVYMYYDETDRVQYLSFDLVSELCWGWVPTIDVQYVFSSRGAFRGIPVASPGCDAAMRLMKAFLRDLPIKENAQNVIRQGSLADEKSFIKTLGNTLNIDLTKELLRCVQDGDFGALESIRKQVRRSVLFRFHYKWRIRAFVAMLRYLWNRVKMFKRGPLGVSVALLGPDGAGKTTLVDSMMQKEGTLFFRGTRVFHHEFHVLPRLSDIVRLFYRPKRICEKCAGINESYKPLGIFRSLLQLGYYSIDFCLGHLILRSLQGRGRLVLFDRYFYDNYFQRGHKNTPGWMIDLFSIGVPKPEVILLLQAEARKIHERKPELTVVEIDRQLKYARSISYKLGKKTSVVTINTNVTVEKSKRQASVAILNTISRKNYGRYAEIKGKDALSVIGNNA